MFYYLYLYIFFYYSLYYSLYILIISANFVLFLFIFPIDYFFSFKKIFCMWWKCKKLNIKKIFLYHFLLYQVLNFKMCNIVVFLHKCGLYVSKMCDKFAIEENGAMSILHFSRSFVRCGLSPRKLPSFQVPTQVGGRELKRRCSWDQQNVTDLLTYWFPGY